MEALRGLWRGRVVPAWAAFVGALGSFLDEASFRSRLAWHVLVGRVPDAVRLRGWNRATETPVLVDAHDWTTDRLVFSLLVWPPLDAPARAAPYDHDERTRQIKEAFGRVCADRAWSVRFETDYGLRWDHAREVWADSGGHAYDGQKFKRPARRDGCGPDKETDERRTA